MFAAWKCSSLVASMAFVACYLLRARWLCLPATWLNVGEAPQTADYVLILDGDRITRPPVAAALYQVGFTKKILVSQVEPVSAADGQRELSEDRENDICRELLREGVPAADIRMVGNHNQSTYDEARALADYLPPDSQATVIVVTNDHHTRRARWIFRQVPGPRRVRISFVAAPNKEVSAERWWQSAAGRRRVFDEHLKFAYYFVRYGRAAYLAVGLAAALPLTLLRRRATRNQRVEPVPSFAPLREYRAAG